MNDFHKRSKHVYTIRMPNNAHSYHSHISAYLLGVRHHIYVLPDGMNRNTCNEKNGSGELN